MIAEGMEYIIEKQVTSDEAASKIGSGGLEVFATPYLIALMERAAYNCVQSSLNEGESTVGTEVNIKHLKATAIGSNVKGVAKLIKIDGRRLDFAVTVYEGDAVVGEGVHSRFIINIEKFLTKVGK